VLGDLVAGLTGTKEHLGGATVHLWGAGLLIAVLALGLAGGYTALEKIQLVIVTAMLIAVIATLVMFRPDWLELLRGFIVPQRFEFPAWIVSDTNPAVRKIAERPVWVELSLYVGAVGGAGYDYLAYASYIRDKQWGNAAAAPGRDAWDDHSLRQWLRAPLVDCTLSFLAVLVFSAVFVTLGKLVLAPAHQIPADGAFWEHQAQFITHIHPRLYPLYVVAVFLAMWGTLYGTLEVAPTVLREATRALGADHDTDADARRMRNMAIGWCAGIALIVLAVSFVYQLRAGVDRPPGLTAILIPVNMFTGVFACGLICLLNPWTDRRLPPQLRMPAVLVALNLIGGAGFVLVALRSYWDYAGYRAFGILLGILAFGVFVTWVNNYLRRRSRLEP
jgi:hypothetical protein